MPGTFELKPHFVKEFLLSGARMKAACGREFILTSLDPSTEGDVRIARGVAGRNQAARVTNMRHLVGCQKCQRL